MATIRDFIAECENYEYSKEYFNIMKECAEIKLKQHYIESQEMIAFETADGYSFTEGYLIESCTPEKLAEYKESVGEAIGNVLKTIGGALKKIWEKFVSILSKLRRTITGEGNFASKKLTDEQAKKVDDVLFDNVEKFSFGLDQKKNIRYVSKICHGKKAMVRVFYQNAVSADYLEKFMERVKKCKEVHQFESLYNELKNAMGKPFEVEFCSDATVPELNSKLLDDEKFLENVKGEAYDSLKELNAMINTDVIPATITLYTEVTSFCKATSNVVSRVLAGEDPSNITIDRNPKRIEKDEDMKESVEFMTESTAWKNKVEEIAKNYYTKLDKLEKMYDVAGTPKVKEKLHEQINSLKEGDEFRNVVNKIHSLFNIAYEQNPMRESDIEQYLEISKNAGQFMEKIGDDLQKYSSYKKRKPAEEREPGQIKDVQDSNKGKK